MAERSFDGSLKIPARIDSNNANEFERALFAAVGNTKDDITIDASDTTYISSAGLRVLLKLKKTASGEVSVINASPEVYDIFEVTGFTKLLKVSKKLREITVDKNSMIGAGASSKVYRIDSDTIVKVYDPLVPRYKIDAEINQAKKAFLAGIPTAISYDIVSCGESVGVVFEMISDAVTVGKALSTADDKEFNAIIKKFAAFMRLMHSTRFGSDSGFPLMKEVWHSWADGMIKYYTAEEVATLKELIDLVPDADTFVHCDFHAGNTFYKDGEIMAIDMADVGLGHPVFDFAAGAYHDIVAAEPSAQATLGLNEENIHRFWKQLLAEYFGTEDPQRLAMIGQVLGAAALLRSALMPMKHPQFPQVLIDRTVEAAKQMLFPNKEKLKAAFAAIDKLGF